MRKIEIFCYDHNRILTEDEITGTHMTLHYHCKEHPSSKMKEIHKTLGEGYPYRRIK